MQLYSEKENLKTQPSKKQISFSNYRPENTVSMPVIPGHFIN